METSCQPAFSTTNRETLLLNFWFDKPVDHTVEALRYALGS